MNQAQKQVQQAQLNDEKKTIRQLKRVYEQARTDCEQRIRELSSRPDLENLQTIIYQKQYQEALKKQLDGIIDNLQGQEFTTVADYLTKSYENGYIGVMYDLHKQGIPITTPINQEQVVKALQTDSKLSKGLYSRLGEDTDYLKKSIRAELSRGIANGSTWNQIAGHIAKGMNSPFDKSINNAIRIARTEGHRIQQKSALDAQHIAKDKGADVVKQWDSTLDNKTRPHHRRLDGQIRELDEPFEVEGMKAQAPGHFGKAKEDCNCRCCLLQRARWALDEDELAELKERAAYFGLDKTKDFDDFKKKFNVAAKQENTLNNSPDSLAGVKRGKPMTFEEADEGKANPHFKEGAGYRINCQTCVVANEARRRGYNVEALPNTNNRVWKNPILKSCDDAWIDPVTGETPKGLSIVSKSAKNTFSILNDTMNEGERYTFSFAWGGRSRSGHIICAYKENGQVKLFDPQSGNLTDTNEGVLAYLGRIKNNPSSKWTFHGLKGTYSDDVMYNLRPELLRVDDKMFNESIMKELLKGVES